MKIFVKVKAKSKQEKVEKIDDSHFKVFVKAPAQDGKANQAIIKVLSKYFKVSRGQIEIISGLSSSQKVVEISV
ncbi:MAG: DUF167 domain-containing protein [Candidatus Pacebacteria bacterium]|nr:DUF167 domain-containing protein [Candidatus Paceibacterota bacterium]